MADITIYHNPRCSKSRQTLKIIEESGVEPDIIEYLKTPPDSVTLDRILKGLGVEPMDLIRKSESVYKELGLRDKQLSRKELIDVMVDNPILIERPIVLKGSKVVLGRPPESVKALL